MSYECKITQILSSVDKEFEGNIFRVDIKEKKLTKGFDNLIGSFTKDLNKLELLSREVGYQSCISNNKEEEEIEKYLSLRNEQILLLNAIIHYYGPKLI